MSLASSSRIVSIFCVVLCVLSSAIAIPANAEPSNHERIATLLSGFRLSFEPKQGQSNGKVKFLSDRVDYSLGTKPKVQHAANTVPAQLLRSQAFFERNDGQLYREVLYLSRGLGYTIFLTADGATLVFDSHRKSGSGTASYRTASVRLSLLGTDPHTEVVGTEELPGVSNYFSGSDPKHWYTRVPHFGRVLYRNAYPGIDLIFYIRDGQLEYDVAASPHADPRLVRFRIEGGHALLDRSQNILIRFHGRVVFKLKKPRAYQADSASHVVSASYQLSGREFSFALGLYDHTKNLVIDPALIFSTYLYSWCPPQNSLFCNSLVNDIAADSTGVYLTGQTNSSSFPARGVSTLEASYRTFVVKLDPSGSNILYMTFLSSSQGSSVAVDSAGAAYVTGSASFPVPTGGAAFPTTAGAFSAPPMGACVGFQFTCQVAFAAKLSPDGASLAYSTLLQFFTPNGQAGTAPGGFSPVKVAVDSNGALYLVGMGSSGGGPAPLPPLEPLPVTMGAYLTTPPTSLSVFVMKLNPNGSALDYATYLGGPLPLGSTLFPNVTGVAVDSNLSAYVAGGAATGYPTTPGAYLQTGPGGFVTKLSPDGSSLVYSTYFDNANSVSMSQISGIAVDSAGEATFVGLGAETPGNLLPASCTNPFPNAPRPFIAKLNASGSSLVYANSFCAQFGNFAGLAMDGLGNSYVAGNTSDPASTEIVNPVQAYYVPYTGFGNGSSTVLAKFDSTGNLVWSTFFGLSAYNSPGGACGVAGPIAGPCPIAVDPAGSSVYFFGFWTISPPITPNAFQPEPPPVGSEAGYYFARIAASLGAAVPIASPTSESFGSVDIGASSAPADVSIGNFGDANLTAPTFTLTGDFSQTNTCSAAVPGGQKCDVNVIFTPTAIGTRTGTLTINFAGSFPSQSVQLTGTGLAPVVSLSPTSLIFSSQTVGTSSFPMTATISNNGTGPLTIATIKASGDFSETNACGSPIAPGTDCAIQVTFTPTATGSRTGTLTITDNASNSPQTLALTGTGGASSLNLAVASGSSNSATVAAGATASYMLVVGGGGVAGTASLSCTGAPTSVNCMSPATVSVNATTATTFAVSVTTTSRMTASAVRPVRDFRSSWMWATALLGLLFTTGAGRKNRPLRNLLCLLPLALVFLWFTAGCGGGSGNTMTQNPGTPAGTYTLIVTATSGANTQSLSLTLTVQ